MKSGTVILGWHLNPDCLLPESPLLTTTEAGMEGEAAWDGYTIWGAALPAKGATTLNER